MNNKVKTDLTVPAVAAGSVADLSLTPPIGPEGTPVMELLATPVDASSGKPSPPTVDRPHYGGEVFVDSTQILHVTGIGGIGSGSVRVIGGTAGDVVVAVDGSGRFDAPVPVALGAQTLKLIQQTFATSPCVAPALCAESYPLELPITVTLATASPKAPVILSPTDPTHSPAAAPLVLNVVGTGTPAPVHVVDQGSVPNVFADLLPDANGKFSGQITLDPGDAGNPNKGWHKLVFDQGGAASHPVFVSVGIDPPTVVFPRNGAEIDCEQPDQQGEQIAVGTLPYPQDVFGRLRVMEETGRVPLAFVGAETSVGQPQPGQPTVFVTHFNPGPGRHVVYFFQAPDPPANATQDEIDAHFRAYARLADTPTSRIVVDRKPPRFPIPQGIAGVFGGRGANGGVFTNLPPPGQAGPLVLGASNCGFNATPPASILCALPNADVNVRVNGRLYTQRADDDGKWTLPIPLPVGWNHLTLAQVSDSRVGGAWSESCLSNEIDVGVQSPGAPAVTVPPDITVDATGPKGAQVFYPNVTAVRPTDGASVPVECVPASGSFFAVGRNEVLCTATDPADGRGRPGRVRDHRHRRSALDQGAEPDAGGDRPGRHDAEGVHQRQRVRRRRSHAGARLRPVGPAPLLARPDDACRLHGHRQLEPVRERGVHRSGGGYDAARLVQDDGPQGRYELGVGRDRQVQRLQRQRHRRRIDSDDLRPSVGIPLPARQDAGQVRRDGQARQQVGDGDVHCRRGRHDAAGAEAAWDHHGDRDQQGRRARQLHRHGHRQHRSEANGEVRAVVGGAVPAREHAGELHGDRRRRKHRAPAPSR